MKRNALIAAATLTLLMTSATDAAQRNAQEEVMMPEVSVTGGVVQSPHHPQDPLYSERPPGCVEVIVPSGGGDGGGAYYAASRAKDGIPVIPSLNDPSSAADHNRKGPVYEQATPAGQEGKPGCQR